MHRFLPPFPGRFIPVLFTLLLTLPGKAALTSERGVHYHRVRGGLPERQRLDVHYDDTKRDRRQPVLVWIHGGAWRFGNKEHSTPPKAAALHKAGIVLVAVNYRFHPSVSYKEQATDIAAAVKWTRKHIAKYGGDPDRIALMGHSAGAHLAALTAIDHSYLREAGVRPAAIKAVILLDGAGYDIPLQIKSARPRGAEVYKTVFTEDPAKQKAASPIAHVKKGTRYPPFLIIPCASRADSSMQSGNLARALRAAGSTAIVSPAKGKTHMTLNREWGLPGDVPTGKCLRFLKKQSAP